MLAFAALSADTSCGLPAERDSGPCSVWALVDENDDEEKH